MPDKKPPEEIWSDKPKPPADNGVIRGNDGKFQKGTVPPSRSLRDRPVSSGPKTSTRNQAQRLRNYAARLCKAQDLPFESPVEMLLYVGITGMDPLEARINEKLGADSPFAESKVTRTDAKGNVTRVAGFIPLDLRLDCIRLASPYLHHKLSSVSITDDTDDALDRQKNAQLAAELSNDPVIRELMEKIAESAGQMPLLEAPVPLPISQGEI